MKIGRSARIAAILILVTYCFSTESAAKDLPPRLAIVSLVDENFPYPGSLSMLFRRALDSNGSDYRPVELTPGRADAAALPIARLGGAPPDGELSRHLSAEARSGDFDRLVVIDAETGSASTTLRLYCAQPPFESIPLQEPISVPYDSLAGALERFAGLAGETLGLGGTPGMTTPHYRIESEERYAEGIETGSIEALESAIAADSRHGPARSELGFRLSLGGNEMEGWALLDAVNADSLPPAARATHRVRLALLSRDEAATVVALDSLGSQYSERFNLYLHRALLETAEGDTENAMSLLRRAIEKRRQDFLPHRLLADLALQEGFLEVAAEEFQRADQLAGGDVHARIGLASTMYSHGEVDGALDLLSMMPHIPPHRRTPMYLISAARANLFLATGQRRAAVLELLDSRDRAHAMHDDAALIDLTARLARTYQAIGSHDEASYEIAELRFRSESEYLTTHRPGLVAFLEGIDGAYREDLGAVSAKSHEVGRVSEGDRSRSQLIEGLYYLRRQSGWEAVPYLRRAVQDHPTPWRRLLLGMAFLEAEELSRAKYELEQLVERGESLLETPPSLPEGFLTLSEVLEKKGERELAKMAYLEFRNYYKERDPGQ